MTAQVPVSRAMSAVLPKQKGKRTELQSRRNGRINRQKRLASFLSYRAYPRVLASTCDLQTATRL